MLVITNRSWSRSSFTGGEAPNQKLAYFDDPERITGKTFRRRLFERLSDLASAPRPLIIVPIHGYNQDWPEALDFIKKIDSTITAKLDDAITVGFSWASCGHVVDYINDRMKARSAAITLASEISRALRLIQDANCPTEICVIAHSMGNFLLSKAAAYASEAHGDPAFQVFSEVLMVAADMDGGAFEPGGDGHALARFSRRITVYRSSHDRALLASRAKRAGLTGRRLGRHGVDDRKSIPSNVVLVDASRRTNMGGLAAHGHYFEDGRVISDMLAALEGKDRSVIMGREEKDGEFVIT